MKNLFHELAQRRDDSFALHNKSRTYIDINSVRNQFILITSEGLSAGLYILERKIKGSGDGKGNQKGKKEKKRNFGENITFYSTKS